MSRDSSFFRAALTARLQTEEPHFSCVQSQHFCHRFGGVVVYYFPVAVMSTAFSSPMLLYCWFRCVMLSTTRWVVMMWKAIPWKQWKLWFEPEKKMLYRTIIWHVLLFIKSSELPQNCKFLIFVKTKVMLCAQLNRFMTSNRWQCNAKFSNLPTTY